MQNAVRIVNTDHQIAMRVNTTRDPNRAPHIPVGISKRPYASVKAIKIIPICLLDRWNSSWIALTDCEMQTRSRYKMNISTQRNASTANLTREGAASPETG